MLRHHSCVPSLFRTLTLGLALGLLGGLASGVSAEEVEAPEQTGVELIEAWPGITFEEPIRVAHANDGSEKLYVVERPGRVIEMTKWRGVGPVSKPKVFLDVRSQVFKGGQGGLLGLVFHPQHKTNGRFYISYLARHDDQEMRFKLVVAEMQARGGVAVPATERRLLQVFKAFPIHQAGTLEFGPDGMLYICVGDGGHKDDVRGNAQNLRGLMGKILRIDVNRPSASRPYSIPADNPFASTSADASTKPLPEIWAYGLRNPWGIAWDTSSPARAFTAEPGTSKSEAREWVTELVAGGNHGWPFFEGDRANPKQPLPPTVAKDTLVPRAFVYKRSPSPDSGSAAVAGRFYRGQRVPALRGRYIFADHSRGELYALTLTGAAGAAKGSDWKRIAQMPDISSIGEDAQGELYVTSYSLGMVFTPVGD